MMKKFNTNLIRKFFIYLLFIFISLSTIQKTNNALPFFYKDYPTYKVSGKINFDPVSELLVLNRIDFSTLSLNYKYNFNLWMSNQEIREHEFFRQAEKLDYDYIATPEYLMEGKPYESQIGFQSLFWAKISSFLDVEYGDYSVLRVISILIISLCSAVIVLWMRVSYGCIPALVGLLLIVFSTGVNIFSESLYWSIWLFIAPLSAVCLLEINKCRSNFVIFIATFSLFLFKFLSGYEFITVIVFSAMTPYVWDFFVNKSFSSLVRVAVVGFASIFAFLVSVFVYDKLFSLDFHSSGLDYIFSRSGSWSLGNLHELNMNPLLQLKKILVMNIFDINGYGLPLGIFVILIVSVLVYFRNTIKLSDLLFVAFLFFGSISWIIVQPGHILWHPRYAVLMFFLPFGLFAPVFLVGVIYKNNA